MDIKKLIFAILALGGCSNPPSTTLTEHKVDVKLDKIEEKAAIKIEPPSVSTVPIVTDIPDIFIARRELPSLSFYAGGGGDGGPKKQKVIESACFEYINNGGFETGDFSGFNISDQGSGSWFISTGDPTPLSGLNDSLPVISGNYDVVSDQYGPGTHLLTQPITVPPNITFAELNFKDRIRNRASEFSDPNQEYRVMLRDSLLNPLIELFSTKPGDALFQPGPNVRSFDLQSVMIGLEDEPIVISFEEEDNLFFFNVNVDDISLRICSSCGNGIRQASEECDDGNNINGDGCSQGCRLEDT